MSGDSIRAHCASFRCPEGSFATWGIVLAQHSVYGAPQDLGTLVARICVCHHPETSP